MKSRIRKKRALKIERMQEIAREQEHAAIVEKSIAHNREELERLMTGGPRAADPSSAIAADAERRAGESRPWRSPEPGPFAEDVGRGRSKTSEEVAMFDVMSTVQWFVHEVGIEEPPPYVPKSTDPAAARAETVDAVTTHLRRALVEHARAFHDTQEELEELRKKSRQLSGILAAREKPLATAGNEVGIARVLQLAGVEPKATVVLQVSRSLASEGLQLELTPTGTKSDEPQTPTTGESA